MSEVIGHANVRSAARDTENYSSDLQGDRDVRTYRQIPLEVDPPRHHLYRTALSPLFVKPKIEKMIPEFEAVAKELILKFRKKGGGDVVSELALPMVGHCLGIIYNRPQDVAEWLSWGADVWITTPTGRSGEHLDRYLKSVFDEAESSDEDNAWTFISRLELDGQSISRTEMYGIANVLLAGGRDTVVKLMTGMIWHLAAASEDREFLIENPDKLGKAIHEVLRYLSPLPRMERVPAAVLALPEELRDPKDYDHLSFVSGNFDESVFSEPDKINIHRERNPHLAFGFGPHTCIGNHVAEVETAALISTFLREVNNWEVLPDSEISFDTIGKFQYPGRFHSLLIKCK
jgi:cytochrome P450